MQDGRVAIKVAIIFISIVLFLTPFQSSESNLLTLEDVLSSFEEQQLTLKKSKVNSKSIFGNKLNGVKPHSFELNDKQLFIYIYKSDKARKKGLRDFTKRTETFNLVSYKYYEVKNVMFFYVHSLDRSMEVPFDKEIQKIVNDL